MNIPPTTVPTPTSQPRENRAFVVTVRLPAGVDPELVSDEIWDAVDGAGYEVVDVNPWDALGTAAMQTPFV